MKYLTPKYEVTAIKIKDIITASSNKYEVVQNNDGSGNVIVNAENLFN